MNDLKVSIVTMIYNNELMKVAMAVSQGSMCKKYDLWFGPEWTVVFTK